MEQSIHVTRQYDNAEPLSIRIQTHSLYTDRKINLNEEAVALMELSGQEAVLDAGCGTGGFLRHLLSIEHQGPLVGVDQSAGMVDQTKSEGIECVLGDVRELLSMTEAFNGLLPDTCCIMSLISLRLCVNFKEFLFPKDVY
ncbi:class I SAM-dependent methyltransferase [Paenibacillus sp. RC67]|uniref:methyltransferase domain-containing protein n=1 Tax=Paenibacillus sp. RC67 TaxID=3039392 RepID=UPI0024ADF6E8|nr:class I SAM-dependent methyltransferase [Paenibacillus sp. RC67]